MKLKFKIQQYQTDAVESVINVFKGQPNQANLEYRMDKGKLYVVDSKKHDIKIVQTDVFADSDDAGNNRVIRTIAWLWIKWLSSTTSDRFRPITISIRMKNSVRNSVPASSMWRWKPVRERHTSISRLCSN